jgi:hypothetical protein
VNSLAKTVHMADEPLIHENAGRIVARMLAASQNDIAKAARIHGQAEASKIITAIHAGAAQHALSVYLWTRMTIQKHNEEVSQQMVEEASREGQISLGLDKAGPA